MNLDLYQVSNFPDKLHYIQNFITIDEEDHLLRNIYNVPSSNWVILRGRRLQNWGGTPHPKGMIPEPIPQWLQFYMNRVSQLGIFGDKQANHVLVNEYKSGQGISPHHDGPLYHPVVATINLGSYGVLDFYNPLAESSSTAACDEGDDEAQKPDSTSWQSRYIGSALLESRSLNIVTDRLYTHYMHGIAERSKDRFSLQQPHSLDDDSSVVWARNTTAAESCDGDCLKRGLRVSVTIRHVPKVCKMSASKLLGRR